MFVDGSTSENLNSNVGRVFLFGHLTEISYRQKRDGVYAAPAQDLLRQQLQGDASWTVAACWSRFTDDDYLEIL